MKLDKDKPKVFIVGSGGGCQYADMYRLAGWAPVRNIKDADLVQFTGGEDVHPSFYGEAMHPSTYANIDRDLYESMTYKLSLQMGKPMAGICRGGQFLNVMNGGRMYQDVNHHGVAAGHDIFDLLDGDIFKATSTHHQMMRPDDNMVENDEAVIVGVAYEATYKEWMETPEGGKPDLAGSTWEKCDPLGDVEIVWYPKTRCFCFQPHPEFPGHVALAKTYFAYLDKYLLNLKKEDI